MANDNVDAILASIDVDVEGNDKQCDTQAEVNNEDEQNPFEKKSRRKTSRAWAILIKHLGICVPRQLVIGQIEKKQKTLAFETTGADSVNLSTFTYDNAKVREATSHMILYHEYAFMHMEHVLFNKFVKTVSPHWQKISRTKAKSDCLVTYLMQKTLLKTVNRISIATDLRKAPGQRVQYMVLTGHFIDDAWKLQKRVLNFCNVPPPHNGVIISYALSKCIQDWGIENKVASITVDNATYNDVALRNLKRTFKLLKKKLLLDGKLFHVRCCAHILNLLIQDGLSVIEYIINCVRDGVKYLVSSEARFNQFSEIAKQLQLPSNKLILDYPMRWNSTYLMLAASLEFKDVFPRYGERDVGFMHVPTYED